jgi:hypothetical protein
MPEKQRWQWFQFNQKIGTFALFGAILLMQALNISLMAGPVAWAFQLLTGLRIG